MTSPGPAARTATAVAAAAAAAAAIPGPGAAPGGSGAAPGGDRPPLPIGKLTGVASELRRALKGQRIATCSQLLAAC